MKSVFGNEEYIEHTEYLASVLLDIPIEEVRGKIRFLQKGLKNARYIDKNGEKDIVFIVEEKPKQKVLIEINYRKEKDETILLRNLYWHCNIFGQGLKKKDITYDHIIRTDQYNLNTFYVDQKHKPMIEEYDIKNQNQNSLLKEKKFKIYHMNIAEMKKVWYYEDIHKYDYRTQRMIRLGALLMIDNQEDFRKCLKEMDIKEEMRENIERIVKKMNEEEDFIYEFFDRETDERMIREGIIAREKRWAREEGEKQGVKKGVKQGIQQGLKQQNQLIIQRLYQKNIDIKDISEITETPIKNIKQMLGL